MYSRYSGYKCVDCDYIASTEDEMKEHIKKKHKNAKCPQDYIGKNYMVSDSDGRLVYFHVRDFDVMRGVFLICSYSFEINSTGDINRYSNVSYTVIDEVLKYDQKECSYEFITKRLEQLARGALDKIKDLYFKNMYDNSLNFIAPKDRS